MSKIHFNKGDIIECPNGHYICEISRDVYVHENRTYDIFINFKDTKEPELGAPIVSCTCAKCGASWIVWGHGRPMFYIKNRGLV